MLRLLSELNTPTEQQVYAIFSREFPSRPARTWAEAAEALTDINNTADVWLTLNPRRVEAVTGGRYGTVSDVVLVNGFAGDVDFGQVGHQNQNHPPTREAALAVIKAVEIKSTLIIETGGGFAPVVLFERPIEVNFENRDRLNALCRRYSNTFREAGRAMGWAVDGGKSIAQIIRVPGTVNRKYDPPRPVTIHEAGGKRYTLEELEALLPAVVERPGKEFTGTVPTGLDANDLLSLPCIRNAVDNSWQLPRDEWLVAGRAICHCDNGPEVFREVSRPYKGYSKEAVDAQIADIQANMKPPLCESIFYDFGGDFCKECPHCEQGINVAGKALTNFTLNSPITLAAQKAHERKEDARKEATGLRVIFGDDLARMELEAMPPVIRGLLNEREGLVIAGRGGIGKSQLLGQLALALASGTPFLGVHDTIRPRNVLMFQSENVAQSVKSRQSRLIAGDCRLQEATGRIGYASKGTSCRIAGSLIDGIGNRGKFVEDIYQILDAFEGQRGKVEIIIFDPLISFHAADENSNSLMRKCCDVVTELCDERKMTAIIAHHHKTESNSKSDGDDYTYQGDLMRGGSAIRDWASTVGTLVNTKFSTRLSWTKVRDYAPPAANEMRLGDAGFEVITTEFSHFLVPRVIRRAGDTVESAETLVEHIMAATDLNGGRPITRSSARTAIIQAVEAGLVAEGRGPKNKKIYTVGREATEVEEML